MVFSSLCSLLLLVTYEMDRSVVSFAGSLNFDPAYPATEHGSFQAASACPNLMVITVDPGDNENIRKPWRKPIEKPLIIIDHFLIWFPLYYTGTRPTSVEHVEPGLCDDPLLIVLAWRKQCPVVWTSSEYMRNSVIQLDVGHCEMFSPFQPTVCIYLLSVQQPCRSLPQDWLHWIGLIMYFYYRAFVLSACSNALCACKMMILQSCLALLPQGKTHIAKVHHIF